MFLSLSLMAASIGVSHAFAQGTPRPRRYIELTETNNAEILTNLNQLSTKKDGLRQLEDQLRLLKSSSSHKSFEDRYSLPYVAPSPNVLPNKTVKELLERKNWALTPDELGMGLKSSDDTRPGSLSDDKLDGASQVRDEIAVAS